MPKKTSTTGSELFIVDNSEQDWKVLRYLHDWCQICKAFDIATAFFEIGALLGLQDEWQKVDQIRILMGNEVSQRTKSAFIEAFKKTKQRLDESIELEKQKNDFLAGVPAIVEAIRSGRIACRVYRKEKFHAKCYITHARLEVVGSSALVGSSNFTSPGLIENIELNVQSPAVRFQYFKNGMSNTGKKPKTLPPKFFAPLSVISRNIPHFWSMPRPSRSSFGATK
jgi:HKD family nuclease